MLELVFFEHRTAPIRHAIAAGLETFIVDWEWRGKNERQKTASTEIDPGDLDDLATAVAAAGPGRVHCRLNSLGEWTPREVDEAIAAGAGCLLLPMVRTPREAEAFLELVGGRSRAGILVETVAAVEAARELAELPLERIYVGLNDLAIERGIDNIFEAVADGTVERLREIFAGREFGFGGVTVVDRGEPIPARLLLAEMERLGTTFSFCRRSFKRDMAGRDMAAELEKIRVFWRRLETRTTTERLEDQRAFQEHVRVGEPAAAR